MIEPRELRIGNIVSHNGTPHTVTGITKKEATIVSPQGFTMKIPYSGIEPEKLTEDWLLRGGFEKNDDPQMHGLVFYKWFGDLKISTNYVAPKSLFLIYLAGPFGMVMLNGISHVHQLQILIHALTNKELTFTEKL